VLVFGGAGSSRPEEGMYAYETNILKLAGEYAVTAEFTETRPELMRLLTRRTSTLRSPPAAFHVHLRMLCLE